MTPMSSKPTCPGCVPKTSPLNWRTESFASLVSTGPRKVTVTRSGSGAPAALITGSRYLARWTARPPLPTWKMVFCACGCPRLPQAAASGSRCNPAQVILGEPPRQDVQIGIPTASNDHSAQVGRWNVLALAAQIAARNSTCQTYAGHRTCCHPRVKAAVYTERTQWSVRRRLGRPTTSSRPAEKPYIG